MKARVKGTVDIIEVEFDKDALNACYPPYHDKENNMYYLEEQLEWVDNEVNANPDYWTRLEHQAAIAAMQGVLANNDLLMQLLKRAKSGSRITHIASEFANACAHIFVEKIKEKEERK